MKLLRRLRKNNVEVVDGILDALAIPSFPGVVTRLLGMLRDESHPPIDPHRREIP